MKILAGAGILDRFSITQSVQFHNGIYFVLVLAIICGYQTLRCTNRPVIGTFPESFLRRESYVPFLVIITATIGVLYIVIPEVSQYVSTAIFCIPLILNGLLTERCLASLRYNPVLRKDLLIMWLFALYLIIVEHIFLLMRFLPDTTDVCRIFDNNCEIPTVVTFALISTATVRKLHAKVRMSLATIQLNSETIRRQILSEEKKNMLMSNLVSDLFNPIQNLTFIVENHSGDIPPELLSRIKRSLTQTVQAVSVIKTLTAFMPEKTSLAKTPLAKNPLPLEKEPVFLKDFVEETILPEITNLKLRNCFADIKYDIRPDAAVLADKPFLSLFLRFLLQTAVNNATEKSTVMISIDYENITFSCTVHFFSEPISSDELNRLLSLDSVSDGDDTNDKRQFELLIKKWGAQLFILKQIVDALLGSISITPTADGNTISASIALEPAVPSATAYSDFLDNARNALSVQNPFSGSVVPQFPEVIYILEEDDDVREELKRLFSGLYKTVALANGNDFIPHIEAGLPDFILCSVTVPGKNAFDILSEYREKLSAPFFVLAKSLSKSTADKLYEAGASGIIEKPFSEKTLLDRISAILQIQRNRTNELFNKIEANVRTRAAGNSPCAELPQPPAEMKPTSAAGNGGKVPVKNASFTAVCVSARLTRKEIEIASLIAQGFSDKKIAETADISPATVAVHNKNIFKKLAIHSRAELIKLAEQ